MTLPSVPTIALTGAMMLAAAGCGSPDSTTPGQPNGAPAAGVRDSAAEAGRAAGGAVQTVDVKAALAADSTVDASDINVDTLTDTRTVVLRGTVATDAERSRAEDIARRRAEGYTVSNQLTVRP